MMRLKYTFYMLTLFFLLGCNDDFLQETPVDFIAAENAFQTIEDFNLSINNLYNKVRREFYNRDQNYPMDYIYGTDIVFDGQDSERRWTPYNNAMRPSGGTNKPKVHWGDLYKIISEANMVLSRLNKVEFSEEKEIKLEAQARFFRAFAYRTLAYLYGGVPLSLEETTEPKFDYVRASKSKILAQCILDANFAVENLGSITEVRDGEINTLAASHLLAEIYLANNEPKKAIIEASKVIDNPNTGLMTARFGSRSSETPGDVYWDLYRKNNQNRASGNTEGLWVIQFETDVDGGGSTSSGRGGSSVYERHHAPFMRDVNVSGVRPFLWPVSDYTGGRGIGWAISTTYFSNTIWENDFNNDIRNANHNFVREFTFNNPSYPDFYGTTISTETPPADVTIPSRSIYAYQSKVTTPFNHPDGLYDNFETGKLKSSAGSTYTDQYMFRLAETYLLRAEAYLLDNQQSFAANDINEIRQRANASPVDAVNVDIDYILDERMRELGIEEKRRITLMRLGLLYDRVTRFNPHYQNIQEIHNLWPIPFSEIERNTGAVLEQNPGYENI